MPDASPPGGRASRRAGEPCAVVVMTGGRATRFGSDKTRAPLAGRPLLDHVLDACPDVPLVVVGPRRPVPRAVTWAREDPPFGGPVAALATGMTAVGGTDDDDVVVLLAADAPFAPAALPRLLSALADAPDGVDGAVGTDASGRRQWLVGAYRTGALRAVLPADPVGRSLRSVLGSLRLVEVPLTAEEAFDVDIPGDLPTSRP